MNRFATDAARYRARGERGKDLWLNPALWTIAFYRLRNWVNITHPAWPVRLPLIVFCFFANKFCEVFMEMSISPRATIGEGLYIGHIGGVHISPFAIIGKNCDIAHRVTIGASGMGRQGAPVIGDNVYIGTGATLVGGLKIGDGARIAANTLVIDDVPAGATVMGVPGRILLGPPSRPRPVLAAAEAVER
jgi:serine O-acetyltransferase